MRLNIIVKSGKRDGEWHRWFAWRPVLVTTDEDNEIVVAWLETVERQYDLSYMGWEYRSYQNKKGE